MTRGLYISTIGMRQQMEKMDVIANNLANVNTTGFKKDAVASRSFSEELMLRVHDSEGIISRHQVPIGQFSSGVFTDEVYTDFSAGSMTEVSDPFAAAINGPGFFTVSKTLATGETVERYTRDGSFTVDANGVLMTKDGSVLQGQNGQITVPLGGGAPVIDDAGNVIVDGTLIDTIRMTDFANYESLRKVGDNSYEATAETQAAGFQGKVVQSYLENSNVNSIKEMVELINVSRIFDANQRFVTTMDSVLNRAVNDIARK